MKKNLQIILSTAVVILSTAFISHAQVASNPPYTLEQSVIAGGGGQNAAGGNFSVDGTIGQSVADTNGASNLPYKVQSGFWSAAPLAPTAAAVSVSGKIVTFEGRGLRNALVILTDMQGNGRTARSSAFGYFRFTNVEAGQTYVLTVMSKRYQFAPQILTVLEDLDNLFLTAQPLIIKTKDY